MTFEERRALVRSYIGKTVDIKIDRPIGYIRKKENYTVTYPLNYGFIPNVLGGDGEELDVYLLGVDVPVREYTGRIIGAVYRKNDNEDKLIMAPEKTIFNQNEIAEQIYFQEKYYKSRIESIYQKSCGAIIYRRTNRGIEYLCLLQKRSRTYSFPKGHMEAFESEVQTAKREIFEEIGIAVNFHNGFREEVLYDIPYGEYKSVILFLAECRGRISIDTNEIISYRWLTANEAIKTLPECYGSAINSAHKFLMLNE